MPFMSVYLCVCRVCVCLGPALCASLPHHLACTAAVTTCFVCITASPSCLYCCGDHLRHAECKGACGGACAAREFCALVLSVPCCWCVECAAWIYVLLRSFRQRRGRRSRKKRRPRWGV